MRKAPRFLRRLQTDRRGIAAVEFALIAPTLVILFMGVLEMSFRFRAHEEATRYVHQAADLISREDQQTDAFIQVLHDASTNMMKPLDANTSLSIDVASIGFDADTGAPYARWRRTIGAETPLNLSDAEGLGFAGETVIRVAIQYDYESPISAMFGGPDVTMVRQAWARPRNTRIITLNGQADDNNGQARALNAL